MSLKPAPLNTTYPDASRWLLIPFFAVLTIWVVYYLEISWGVNFNTHGIYPQRLSGLQGVVFSPFIHGSLDHLYNNSFPLLILLAALIYFFPRQAWQVILWGILTSGLLTWLIGRPSYHIGASGLIYVLASFIFFKGIRSGHYRWVALSLGVVFVYGSMLWYVLPVKEGISWEGHLSGLLSGLALSWILPNRMPTPPKYAWEAEDYKEEEDAFMRHFDADGNFIEQLPEEQIDADE
jgi:membrane associated rhomboid family serine protease